MKTIVKNYQGYTFIFKKRSTGSFEVSAQGFNHFWFQPSVNVKTALTNFKRN
jgi:hypothetical protein